MTVRLLTDWPYRLPSGAGSVTIPAGSVVSVFDSITETGMIAQKLAVLTAAAVTWTPPSEAKTYDELSPAEVAQVRARLVPGDGISIASADLATTTGEAGATYRISDGPDAGAPLVWATPAGASSPTWCWWAWPQSAYEG